MQIRSIERTMFITTVSYRKKVVAYRVAPASLTVADVSSSSSITGTVHSKNWFMFHSQIFSETKVTHMKEKLAAAFHIIILMGCS